MPSLFRPNGRKDRHDQPPKPFFVPSSARADTPAAPPRRTHQANEFGGLSKFASPLRTPTRSGPRQRGLVDLGPRILPPKYVFASTRLPPKTTTNSVDLFAYSQDEATRTRRYGFLGGVGSNVTLSLEEVARVIKTVGAELEQRGLTTPRLFSNQALELSPTRVRMLIQSYVDSLRSPSTSQKDAWVRDLAFVKEHDLGWLLRWALGRITRIKEGTAEILHGLLDWEVYEEWRGRERASNYPLDAFPFLSALVPADVYHTIIAPLLRLLSRFAAHSHLSGLTPHALSAIFSPFFFDIPTSSSCMAGHSAFIRATYATEHLLLSYIRSSGQGEGLGVTNLPGRLQEWVTGYPAMVASEADLARAVPRRGARTLRCERASRTVRAYSKDLIASAETWAADFDKWDAWERVLWNSRRNTASRPKVTASYKRRMCIKDDLPLSGNSSTGMCFDRGISGSRSEITEKNHEKIDDDGGGLLWGSLAGKEWSTFEEGGFDAPTLASHSDDMRSRLQFDLNESAKLSVAEKRKTLNWSEFANPSGGFTRTDPALDVSLSFAQPLASSINEWPKERADLNKRLQKSQKEATPFHYNTKPKVGLDVQDPGVRIDQLGRVYVEDAFVNWWADWAIGGGWMDREELTFREANWALINYQAVPSRPEDNTNDPLADPRTSELWFIFEERVPLDYQLAVADPKEKKTLATLFHSRKNKANQSPPKTGVVSGWDDSDFDRMLLHRERSKKLYLSSSQPPQASLWHLTPEKAPVNILPTTCPRQLPPRSKTRSYDGDGLNDGEGKPSFFSKSKERVIRRAKSRTEDSTRDKSGTQETHVIDQELRSAGGGSSSEHSPSEGVPTSREKWMEILIANGAKLMDRRNRPVHIRAAPAPPSTADMGAIASSPAAKFTPRTPRSASQHTAGASSPTPSLDGEHSAQNHETLSIFPYRTPERSGSDLEVVTPHEQSSAGEWHVERNTAKTHDWEHRHHQSSQANAFEDVEYDYRSSGFSAQTRFIDSVAEGDIPRVHERPVSREIYQPSPRRDTIHNIVDTYRDSTTSTMSDPEEAEITFRSSPDDRYPMRFQADGLVPPTLGPVFDLTPGREPSPARYKHGEPLQLVGEEEEEQEYY